MATFNAGFNGNAFQIPTMMSPLAMILTRSPGELEMAVVSNNIDLLKSLLEQDSMDESALKSASNGEPLIQRAAERGYDEIVDLLIASKHQLPESQRKQSLGEALMLAVRGGHGEVVRSLCVEMGGVDHRGPMGDTAFMQAVRESDLEIMNTLLFYGADLNATNASGSTPLTLAIMNNDLRVLQALLAHDARVSEADERLDLEAVGCRAVTAMEHAVLIRHKAQSPTSWPIDKTNLEVADQMIQALRNSKAAEVDKSVGEILTKAYWRKASGPNAATTRLLNEMKEMFEPNNVVPKRFISNEEHIRIQNFEYFQRRQAEGLAYMVYLYGYL